MTAGPKLRIYSGFSTDAGKVRQKNEDALYQGKTPLGYLAAVADGMGEEDDAESVASYVLSVLVSELEGHSTEPMDALRAGFDAANRALMDRSTHSRTKLGATCAVALISHRQLFVGHVGNARVYLLRGANLYALTRDHTLLQEIADKKGPSAAKIFAAHYRHVVSKSVGAAESIEPTLRPPLLLTAGDVVLLCSDGLTTSVEESVIRRTLAGSTPREAAGRLVYLANEAGGKDNTAVIVLRVDADIPEDEHAHVLLDTVVGKEIHTAEGSVHRVSDAVINPSSWSVVSLRIDITGAEQHATCEVPVTQFGPILSVDDRIITPQSAESLIDSFRVDGPTPNDAKGPAE